MLMTLRTRARTRSMIAWLTELRHFRFSFPPLRPFLVSPQTSYEPQTATHKCTVPFHTSCYPPLPSTYFLPSAHTRLPPPLTDGTPKQNCRKVCSLFTVHCSECSHGLSPPLPPHTLLDHTQLNSTKGVSSTHHHGIHGEIKIICHQNCRFSSLNLGRGSLRRVSRHLQPHLPTE